MSDASPQPGDIVLVHAGHVSSRLIRWGQRLRFRGERAHYAHWNHVAVITGYHGELIEALFTGVKEGNLSRYANVDHVVCSAVEHGCDRVQMLAFCESVARARWRYDYAEIVSVVLTLLTGSKWVFGRVGSAICSGLAAEALTRAGVIWPRPPGWMLPADIAEHFKVAA